MNIIQKARQMVGEVQTTQGKKLDEAWALVGRILGRLPVDADEADRVVRERDVAGLDAIVGAIENPGEAPGPAEISEAVRSQMAGAMRAFRKRLKLARLADESKLGGRQLSGGRRSEIDAIQPPTDYPREVWDALVADGQLKHTGGGFYAPVD
ncbi:MAG: hypothetical protein ACF8QF_13905 [Phycisphaerales bacterium]